MKAPISEIVGGAKDGRGKDVVVYRALRPLICCRCGSGINKGNLFTRRKLAGIRISPFCRECVPFKLPDRNFSSPLIEFLLKTESAAGKGTEITGTSDRALTSKEVERRLGPVLALCRKRRREDP